MSETLSTFSLKPGDGAPDFNLPAPDGTMHSLGEVAGSAGLLVVFACNHCPYVIHLAEILGDIERDYRDQGLKVVAISSNDIEKYPQDAPELMEKFAAESRWDFPYLYDATQEVAKAYGAACTPDFFLFDKERRLFYAGQMDDTRPRSGQKPDGSDLKSAIESMLAGKQAISHPRPSSGCNIKWIPGNEPSYFG
ncbi:thioredoxin family protein [Haloferula chungangensis]|uniref:Thioredoxin family protein n=1 Tax=Haloferula chungangensis TaxID=1048331 RepID=A0ABW2L3V2_9BACT